MEWATKPFHMRFTNPRLEKLTSRVICLSVCAAFLVVLGVVLNFFSEDNIGDEFHVPESVSGGTASQQVAMTPQRKIMAAVGVLALALIVPLCGYCGAKKNNRSLVCCFSWCNCVGGCLNLLTVVLIAFSILGIGGVQSACSPSSPDGKEQCKSIMDACSKFTSSEFALDTYEGCYDFMVSKMPFIQGILALVLALRCCSVCFECTSAYYGHELYKEMDHGECIDSADEAGWE
eukprot:TRINITY_DN15556_c0_g3_i1.p1 TRINITY_DN15556_c0_g3~~TRINITY_DN15556_c0_g3_i1.p1  ORF type:complete len:258 (+),score=48.09 TRINITY_DN15556_c0_g3_i1:77-775(+)